MFFSCGKNTPVNNCFQNIDVSESLNLSLPQFTSIQVSGTNIVANLPQSGRRVLIIRNNQTSFTVFDLQCPKGSCNTAMKVDYPILLCSCSQKRYSALNGCLLNKKGECIDDGSCPALRYNAQLVNNSTLLITN